MKKALRVMIICMLCIIIGACFVACGDNTMQGGGSARLLDFVGLRFEGETFEYDGTEHRIEVKGAPADATIAYKNNAVTEVGEYTATATVSKEGYNSKTLSAKIVVMPSAKLLVSARALAKNDRLQNYDFYLNLAGTVDVLGITETANANYDGKYRFDQNTGAIKFRRQTSGLLLVDST